MRLTKDSIDDEDALMDSMTAVVEQFFSHVAVNQYPHG